MNIQEFLPKLVQSWDKFVDSKKTPAGDIPTELLHLHLGFELARKFCVDISTVSIKSGIDWTKVDWKKSNLDLAQELGVTFYTVNKHRCIFGFKSTKILRKLNWGDIDWTKSNADISRETQISLAQIQKYRNLYNKPLVERVKKSNQKVTAEMLSKIDWLNQRDRDIASLFGISRERVRQLRIEKNCPDCRFQHEGQRMISTVLCVEKHKSEFEGKTLDEISNVIKLSIPTYVKKEVIRALVRCGVNYRQKEPTPRRNNLDFVQNVNWDLPNKVLQQVYGKTTFAVKRDVKLKQRAKYFVSYLSHFWDDPQFMLQIEQEILKAENSKDAIPGARARVEAYILSKKKEFAEHKNDVVKYRDVASSQTESVLV